MGGSYQPPPFCDYLSYDSSSGGVGGGIVGVQPWPIHLERIPLYELQQQLAESSAVALSGNTLNQAWSFWSSYFTTDEEEEEPVWLQDESDESLCLGPTGSFSACGDATLWFVQKRTLLRRPRREASHGGIFGNMWKPLEKPTVEFEPPITGWSFQFVVYDYEMEKEQSDTNKHQTVNRWRRIAPGRRKTRRRGNAKSECLSSSRKGGDVSLQACRRDGSARTSWIVNQDGSLRAHLEAASSQSPNRGEQPLPRGEAVNSAQCLYRDAQGHVVLHPCDADRNGDTPSPPSIDGVADKGFSSELTKVQFSFVRYRAVAVEVVASDQEENTSLPESQETEEATQSPSNTTEASDRSRLTVSLPEERITKVSSSETSDSSIITHVHDLAHAHASEPAVHDDKVKLGLGLLSNTRKQKEKNNAEQTQSPAHKLIKVKRKLLKAANPLLFVEDNGSKREAKKGHLAAQSSSASTSSEDQATLKRLRMQTHPYLAESKNEIWTDPLTGLEYRTDICKYLGLDRATDGRHTLMGVGQFRKGYVVKVYGVAYYISKRDALADPSLQPYAGMTADELRRRPEFYKLLRSQGPGFGQFDRTIVMKLNMQLSANTIRSSFKSYFTTLSEEAMSTMLSSSLKPRQADEDALKVITSPENPNRCSCSLIAPEEYKADPSCCPRGTELAFTWLKDGHFEVRLNGKLGFRMLRPDMGEGLFYEFLRTDDPMSPELTDRVVVGFPFLLGPLAQVEGVSSIGSISGKGQEDSVNPVSRMMNAWAGEFSSRANELSETMQNHVAEAAAHAGSAFRSVNDAAVQLGREVERRRVRTLKTITSLSDSAMKLAKGDHGRDTVDEIMDDLYVLPELQPVKRVPQGKLFGYPLSTWFSKTSYAPAPDEIGPMAVDRGSFHDFYLAFVHMYLLLIFIVSFPGSYTITTKLGSRNGGKSAQRKSRALVRLPMSKSARTESRRSKSRQMSRTKHLPEVKTGSSTPCAPASGGKDISCVVH